MMNETIMRESNPLAKTKIKINKPIRINTSELPQVVNETLQRYKELIAGLPKDFQEVSLEYSPLSRGSPSLVTYSAFLVAEPFGIEDYDTISRRTGLAALCFDHFTHLLDDATDSNGATPRESALRYHAANELNLNGISIANELVRDASLFNSRLIDYWHQASQGERYLWKHHKKVCPYGLEDMKMLGKRGSMAKVPIAIYSGVSGREELMKPLENAIEDTAIAIQLLDDLFDWKEDFKDAIYTQPIVLATQKEGRLDSSAIEQGLFFEGVFNRILKIAQEYLDNARNNFKMAGASNASELVRRFTGNIAQVTEFVDTLSSINLRGRDLTSMVKEYTFPLLTSH